MKQCLLAFCLLVAACSMSVADSAPSRTADVLFGLLLTGDSIDGAVAEAYEKGNATASFVRAEWGMIEPSEPAEDKPELDFTAFDSAPFARSAKTRVCVVSFANPWVGRMNDAGRAARLAERYAVELAKHAYKLGIRHFWLPASDYSEDRVTDYVRDLKLLSKAARQAGADTTVIAGPAGAEKRDIDKFYGAGARGFFDALAIDAGADSPGLGIDLVRAMNALGAAAGNGDGGRKLFIIARAKDDLKTFADNAYRNVVTARSFLDQDSILGAAILAKADAAAVKEIPSQVPSHSFECTIESGSPVLNYIAGKPYPLTLKFSNKTGSAVKLGRFWVDFPDAGDVRVEVVADGDPPADAAQGADVTAAFKVTFPESCIGRTLMVRGNLDYTLDGAGYRADCYAPAVVTPELEVNLLPQRLVIGPGMDAKTVGMSVINHNDKLYSGDVVLTPYSGIKTSVTQRKIVVDPFGLDAFVFKVEREPSTQPGRYAIMVDVGGKTKDWFAVDVTLGIKKSSGKIDVDGDLKDWKDAEWVRLLKTVSDGKPVSVGKAAFAYDENALYAAFEIEDAKHVFAGNETTLQDSIQIAFDPRADGARSPEGGFRDDDYEYALQGAADHSAVVRLVGPSGSPAAGTNDVAFQFKHDSGKSVYEVSFPWNTLAPLNAGYDRYLGLSVLVNMTDGGPVERAEWGGGIWPKVDPRAFVPAVLIK